VSIFIHKAHNVSVMLYRVVCVAKYRRVVLTEPVDTRLKEICLAIADRYPIHFLEIGTDKDHVHFLTQTVPTLLPQRMVQIIKSITAREMFQTFPHLRAELWGSAFWTSGYFISTVGRTGSENAVRRYVQSQGRAQEYHKLHDAQLTLFDR
jgi:REP element-mobilizing transposase RayT